jgi:hypothetical protein
MKKEKNELSGKIASPDLRCNGAGPMIVRKRMKIRGLLAVAALAVFSAASLPAVAEDAAATTKLTVDKNLKIGQAADACIAKVDFDNKEWVNYVPAGYSWVENGGVDSTAGIVIERKSKADYNTFGIKTLNAIEPGKYKLSAYVKVEEFGDGKPYGVVCLDLYNKAGYVTLKKNGIGSGSTGGAWLKIEGEIDIPAGVANGGIVIIIPKGSTGRVSFDNVVLEKLQ